MSRISDERSGCRPATGMKTKTKLYLKPWMLHETFKILKDKASDVASEILLFIFYFFPFWSIKVFETPING